MPKQNGIEGYSKEWTPIKQRFVKGFISTNMIMVVGAIKRYEREGWTNRINRHYYYFDMNAGSGYIDELSLDGSPIIAAKAAQSVLVPESVTPYMVFVEKEQEPYKQLRTRIHNSSFSFMPTIWHMDNRECITTLRKQNPIMTKSFGLAYFDPNGPTQLPVEELPIFANQWPKVDILINLPAASYNRVRTAPQCHSLPYIHQLIKAIGKDKVMVREPEGKYLWSMLGFTNGPALKWKKQKFHLLDSPYGQRILQKLTLTNREREGIQTTLFDFI